MNPNDAMQEMLELLDAHRDGTLQVFDGEVELFAPGSAHKPAHRLLGGAGLSWQVSGVKAEIVANPASFPSFDEVRLRTDAREKRQFAAWQEWSRSVEDDPRIAVRYTFEPNGTVLHDRGDLQAHGSIVGCEWANGRWAKKGALEFKRPGDRVRVNILGSYDALTFMAWIRADATPERHMALLLTDGFEVAQPHWQLAPPGDLRLGLRIPSTTRNRKTTNSSAPDVISLGRLGVWSFVTTVYDRQSGRVKHYLDGRQVASTVIRFDKPLTIGSAEIGNWGVTLGKGTHPVRNFIGRMDEFTLWKVALGAEEIRDIHSKTRP